MTTQYIRYPAIGGGGGIPTYASFASLPATAADGATAITLDTDTLYIFNLGTLTWRPVANPGDALGVGTIDSQTPSANGVVITAGGNLIMQSASGLVPGLVNLAAQTLAGVKTFSSAPNLSSLTASLPLQLDASKNIVALAIPLGGSAVSGLLGVGNGGTGIGSGTSGGVLAFTASGTLASSAALVANALVLGGGVGAAPATPVGLGTTTTVLHGNASGAPSFSSVVLTTDVSGILGVSNGGTGLASPGSSGNVLTSNGSAWISSTPTMGTVTSVAMTVPAFLSVSGSPITSSGTLALTLATEAANIVFAGPTTGAAAAPTFRSLVAADIPALSYVSSVGLSLPAFITVSGSPVTSTGTLTGTLASQSQNLVFASPDGSSGAPTFRSLVAGDIPSLSYVSSVGLSAPAEFTVSGSPVTSSGTLTFTKATQSANLVYAGPSSGGAVAPTFRSLVSNDLPALDASKITTGQIAVANGGTGLASPGSSGNVLTSNGSAWVSQAPTVTTVSILRKAVFITTTTYTVDASILSTTVVKATVIGGGAAGGNGGSGSGGAGGGGGGSGGVAIKWTTGTALTGSIVITVGGVGATSSLGAICSATGGTQGSAGSGTGTSGLGGAPGVGSSGDINLSGGSGATGTAGVAAVINGSGGSGGNCVGEYGGGGGFGGFNSTAGGNGGNYGAGGGGGGGGGSSSAGAGTNGIVVLEWIA